MAKENTAELMSQCLNGKISIKKHIGTVWKVMGRNAKDILPIAILLCIPSILMYSFKVPMLITSVVSVLLSAISVGSITILIDNRAKGGNISWTGAIKLFLKNPAYAIGAFFLQNLLVSFIGASFLSTLLATFVMVNIQFAVLSGLDMFTSTSCSFKLISENLLDAILKNILLTFLLQMIVVLISTLITSAGITSVSFVNGVLLAIFAITSAILTISSIIFYYNLPTVEKVKRK